MLGEWESIPFEHAPLEIIDGDRGKNYPSRQDQFENGHCLFLNAGNVTSGGFDFSNKVFITEERDKLLRQGKLERDDIVLTTRGTVGNVAYYDNKVPFDHLRINSGMVIIRTKKNELDSRYAYYFLTSKLFSNQVNMLRTGSAQPQLPIKDINQIKIPLPPLATQERIADILGTLDDKIELNRQMNRTLEAMARAIFKSWFVDFDPVYAKMEGRDYPLPAEVLDLFPNELVESELGLIPKGWEVKPFGKLLTYHLGGDWGKETLQDDFTVPARIIRGTDLPSLHEGGRGEVPLRYLKKNSFDKRILQNGDIIIEVSGGSKGQPTGRSLLVTQSLIDRFDYPICPTSFCRLFRPKNIQLSAILNLQLRIIYDQGKTWNYQHQSTGISNFQTKYFLKNELVIVPTKEVLKVFSNYVLPMLEKMQTNESVILGKIRDTLLPKLMGGKIGI